MVMLNMHFRPQTKLYLPGIKYLSIVGVFSILCIYLTPLNVRTLEIKESSSAFVLQLMCKTTRKTKQMIPVFSGHTQYYIRSSHASSTGNLSHYHTMPMQLPILQWDNVQRGRGFGVLILKCMFYHIPPLKVQGSMQKRR